MVYAIIQATLKVVISTFKKNSGKVGRFEKLKPIFDVGSRIKPALRFRHMESIMAWSAARVFNKYSWSPSSKLDT